MRKHKKDESAPFSPNDRNFEKFMKVVKKCHTPLQFKKLIESFWKCIPYTRFIYGWGYHQEFLIAYWGHDSCPADYLDYYMGEGVLKIDPLFKRWLSTGRCQNLDRILKTKAGERIERRYLEKTEQAGLLHTLAGGTKEGAWTAFFAAAFASESIGRDNFKKFEWCVPLLSEALRKAYPFPKLTSREWRVLNLLSLGDSQKEISQKLQISEATVQFRLKKTREKLHARNNENAVRKGIATGLLSLSPHLRWRDRM